MTNWIISSSILILLVVMMRYLFQGKISLKLQYALWIFVAIRLLLPISFGDSVFSVEHVTNELKVQTSYYAENNTINHLDRNIETTYQDMVQTYENLDKGSIQKTYLSNVSWETLCYFIWFIGAVVLGLIFIISNVRFQLKIRKERKQIVVDNVKIPVYLSSLINTPCLVGFFMPNIYVTESVVKDSTLLRHSIMHEMTHYRHGDSVWGFVRCICLVIHWYNPLVWWAAILSKRDAELACDEATIQKLGEEERVEYGKTLLYLSCEKKQNLFVMTTTMTSGKKSIKERILLIAKKPKITKYALLCFIFLAGVVIGCTFTKAKEEKESQKNIEVSEEDTKDTIQEKPTDRGEPMVIPSFGEEPINLPTPEVTPLSTIEQSMANQKDMLEDELEHLRQEANYYKKAEKDKVCLAVMPDGISLAGGDYRYLIPEDQEYWLAEYKKMVSIASEGGWKEGELSNGIWIVYQDEWTHITNQGFIVDFSKRVSISEASEFYELCMEEARKNGTGTPIRPEEIKNISSATLNYNGTYTITDKTILVKEIEHYFSQSTEIRGGAACPFTASLMIELENGTEMTIFLATDSCSVWLSDGVYYEYSGYENIEQIFWLFSSINN